uniref:G-protein coupled receptors family 1 profile domain-containing protein n=1 Tax=Bracon brevicornis TaxID=1563983 RepID=A0A6V7LFQ7_9HYME
MPSLGSTDMNSVNNAAGSLASTSIFEENMSTLVNWLPSSNTNSSSSSTIVVNPPSSTASVTSSSTSSLSTPSLSLTPVVVKPETPTIITTTTSIESNEKYETVGVRGSIGERLTTVNCPNNYPCGIGGSSNSNEDQVTDSLVEQENSVDSEQEEDGGYASGDESTNIDDDIFIEVSSISDRSDEELNYNTEISEKDTGLLFGFDEDLITMEDNLINNSLLNNSTVIYNASNDNDTYILLGDGRYPSGFSTLQTILAAIAGVILMFVVIIGNMLVIIAIATEKALKGIQNWFIASLAVADFFLGLVIMPFSLANEILGYWVFGYWWCDIYSAMDVLLCTASIMNLCLISLDRYWSITKTIVYLKKRTPARAALMIALVWILSALICIPPLLGWKRPRVEEEYPMCRVS